LTRLSDQLTEQLRALGLRAGDTVMVHSSFRALGIRDPETILRALQETLGEALLDKALEKMRENPFYFVDRTEEAE
jgi:aminoglycoside N3'-acetyltransferase